MLLTLWSTVLPERLLLGNVRVEVDQWGHQDVGGIHDLVAHDDFSKGHVVQLLLGVRLYRLDLGLACHGTWEGKIMPAKCWRPSGLELWRCPGWL